MLSLGDRFKQAGDEGNLPGDVSFAHTSDLSLAKHVHDLVSLERSLGRFHRKEAHPGLDESFDETMVLLDQVVQVFDLSQFNRRGEHSDRFEFCNSFGIAAFLSTLITRGADGVRLGSVVVVG